MSDRLPQPSTKTAARMFAEAYYKAEGRYVNVHEDKGTREWFADLRYVEWLEKELDRFVKLARDASVDMAPVARGERRARGAQHGTD